MTQTQEVIEGWRGVCVAVGLGKPSSRAMCAALLTGVACYALKVPRSAFREDGRPSRGGGFLLTPLAVGATIYLLT